MTFPEFVRAYLAHTIQDDAAWRAYNIQRMATDKDALEALKHLGYRRGSAMHRFEQVAAEYRLTHAVQARHLLAYWYVWSLVALHGRKRGLIKRSTVHDD